MPNTIEYSRFLVKGTNVAGVIPTIPSGDTIDNTWLTTDILDREMFVNTNSAQVWIRTGNALYEFTNPSAYFSGGTVYSATTFNDTVTFLNGVEGIPYLTGGTISAGTLTLNRYNSSDVTITGLTDTYVTGGTYSSGTTVFTNNYGNTFIVTGFTTDAILKNTTSTQTDEIKIKANGTTGVYTYDTAYAASGSTKWRPYDVISRFTDTTGSTSTQSQSRTQIQSLVNNLLNDDINTLTLSSTQTESIISAGDSTSSTTFIQSNQGYNIGTTNELNNRSLNIITALESAGVYYQINNANITTVQHSRDLLQTGSSETTIFSTAAWNADGNTVMYDAKLFGVLSSDTTKQYVGDIKFAIGWRVGNVPYLIGSPIITNFSTLNGLSVPSVSVDSTTIYIKVTNNDGSNIDWSMLVTETLKPKLY